MSYPLFSCRPPPLPHPPPPPLSPPPPLLPPLKLELPRACSTMSLAGQRDNMTGSNLYNSSTLLQVRMKSTKVQTLGELRMRGTAY